MAFGFARCAATEPRSLPLFFDAPKPTSSSPFNGGSVALRQESNCCNACLPVSSILLTASRYSAAATSSACARGATFVIDCAARIAFWYFSRVCFNALR